MDVVAPGGQPPPLPSPWVATPGCISGLPLRVAQDGPTPCGGAAIGDGGGGHEGQLAACRPVAAATTVAAGRCWLLTLVLAPSSTVARC